MLRNHVSKSALVKRINLLDTKTLQMVQFIKLFYFFLVRKFKNEENITFSDCEDLDSFISDVLDRIMGSTKRVIPKEIEDFLDRGEIDFDSFSLEVANKCSVCGKMSSIELDKKSSKDEIVSCEATSYFCSTCFSIFKKTVIHKVSPTGQNITEIEEDIEYYGNSVLAAVYEVISHFNLEKKYSKKIFDFCVAIIDYVYSDDDKPHRYFVKLFEEMAEDFIIYKLVFLNPNYKYDYPNYNYTYL